MPINKFISQQLALIWRIGLLLVLFTLLRFIFFLFNASYFRPVDFVQVLKAFYYGVRFDFIVIYYLNFLFIVLHLFGFELINRPGFQQLLKGLYLVVNAILMLFNVIDIRYFQYTRKRSGWELIDMLRTSSDTKELLPNYLIHYWYLLLLFFLLIYLLFRFYPGTRPFKRDTGLSPGFSRMVAYSLAVVILLTGFAFARGIKTKPLRLISVNEYVTPEYSPLLLNTPFVIINTVHHHKEGIANFYPLNEIGKYYSSLHHPKPDGNFKNLNVVIFILESFSKEYTEATNNDGHLYTPFLDSVQKEGIYCSHAFANARRSIEAMPAILGGFPSLLHMPYISSSYSLNAVRGLPAILNEQGYTTAFYHGGKNGTMGFDLFCKSVGFEHYYGKTEYNNKKDFDGVWGIWDEEFLQYVTRQLGQTKQPFLSVVFTLSSHQPCQIPEKYMGKFFPGSPDMLRSVAYTDYALKEFFSTASKMPWFNNTLFVFCPDHTSVNLDRKFSSPLGRVSIPIIYFCPSDPALRGNYAKVTQQLDIIPTILEYLNYNKSFVSYGKSIFEEGYRFSVSYSDPNFQVIDSMNCLLFDGENIIKANTYSGNSLAFTANSKDQMTSMQKELVVYLKAYLEDYYFRLNHNLLADTTGIIDP
jgi:phosphoglycerol transferase MdoB-like AlkP superfamily enzyme